MDFAPGGSHSGRVWPKLAAVKAVLDTRSSRALLVSIRTPNITDEEADESLAELERLVTTLGLHVVGRQWQRRPSTSGGTVVGEGKLKELARLTGGKGVIERHQAKKNKAAERRDEENEEPELPEIEGEEVPESQRADAVVFDCDLSPSQLRNLQTALGCEVLDRTGVIIEIFSRHAKTRAARLQVEIARLNYLAPRLRETGGPSERQAGRGAGDSELELDRRRIRDRLTELKAELEAVQREQVNRRSLRAEQSGVALVGYTNAGKSSTMRALTGSEVLVQDKLFATLDTTVRALQPETHPRILVSDTVGFIKKLPHDLVASFRSTLDEALGAALLLYVVDASDPTFRQQLAVTYEVLDEVGVEDTPSLLILNKIDRVDEIDRRALKREYPDAIQMSSRDPADIKKLRERIVSFFEREMAEVEILARYDVPGIIGDVRSHMRVVSETYDNEGVRLRVRAKPAELERIKKKYKL